MVRSRPPKKLRKVCRLIFRLIETHKKVVFPRTPKNPRGLIAFIFEGTNCFIVHSGDVSPFTFTDFLEYQTLKTNATVHVPIRENQKTPYIS